MTSQILNDEFSRGFRGRVRVLNGFRSPNDVIHALRIRMQGHSVNSADPYPDAVVLAHVANISIEQFIRQHSLLPLMRAVARKDSEAAHGNFSSLDIIQQYGLRNWSGGLAKYCTDCIGEDINRFGFSYWHRSHQLPGIYWCTKHQVQLAISSKGGSAFDDIPFVESSANYQFSPNNFREIIDNEVVRNFLGILNAFLNFERPMLGMDARFRISKQLKKRDLKYHVLGRQLPLSDFVKEKVPSCWLATLYPGIDKKEPREHYFPIDCISGGVGGVRIFV